MIKLQQFLFHQLRAFYIQILGENNFWLPYSYNLKTIFKFHFWV